MTCLSLTTLGHFPYCQKQHPKFHLASRLYLAWPSSTFKNLSPIPSKHHPSCLLAKLMYRLLTKQTSLFAPCVHLCIPVSPTGTPFPLRIHLPHSNSIHLTQLEAQDRKPIKEFFLWLVHVKVIPSSTSSSTLGHSRSYFNLSLSFFICKTIILLLPVS